MNSFARSVAKRAFPWMRSFALGFSPGASNHSYSLSIIGEMTQILLFYQRQSNWEINILTWKCKSTIWRCISYWKWGFSIAMFVLGECNYQLPMMSILPWLRKEKTHRFVAVACFMLLCWYGEMVLVKPAKFLCGEKTTRDVKLVMSIDHQSLKSYFFPNDLLTHRFDGIAGIVGCRERWTMISKSWNRWTMRTWHILTPLG